MKDSDSGEACGREDWSERVKDSDSGEACGTEDCS